MNRIGHKIIHLDVVDSTNNYVAKLIKEGGLSHGTAIMADEQTQGRGQRGTIWQSEPGLNLNISIYAEFEHLRISDQAAIHHIVALSLCDFLLNNGVKSCIKWPNDILTDNGKIAGILIENSININFVKHSIVGIGLNVNQQNFGAFKATSIYNETQMFQSPSTVAIALLACIQERFSRWNTSEPWIFRDEYHQMMWGNGQSVQLIQNDVLKNGVIRGTNDFGFILVEIDGKVKPYDIKELKFII